MSKDITEKDNLESFDEAFFAGMPEDGLSDVTDTESSRRYDVWIVSNNNSEDEFEYFVDYFDTGAEAIKCAKFFSDAENIELLKNKDPDVNIPEGITLFVEVDLIIEDSSAILFMTKVN